MNKVTSIVRIAILLAAASIAIIAILSEPLPDSSSWSLVLVNSKVIGIAIGYLTYRLAKMWRNDPLISKYTSICLKADSTTI